MRQEPVLPDVPDFPPDPDEPIYEVFTRTFYKNIHRVPGGHATTLFWHLVDISNRANVITSDIQELCKRMKLGRAYVYRIMNELREANTVVQVKRNVWMIDPSLVFRGPSRYHRMTRMQFGKIADDQKKEFQLRAQKRRKGEADEQCDLQTGNGDPDPAHDGARAECA